MGKPDAWGERHQIDGAVVDANRIGGRNMTPR
jgi:hypothetical protein